MPNTIKTKKRNIFKRVIGGLGTVLASPWVRAQSQKIDEANLKAYKMFWKQVPTSLPTKVRQNAKRDLMNFVRKSNYAGARKYIKGLTD